MSRFVSLVLSRLDYGNADLAGPPVLASTGGDERGSTAHLRPALLRSHSRRTHQPPLAPGSGLSGESAVQDGRAHVQGNSWNCAVIPESTGSCRRSAWSTFPPLCSDQSSAGAVRESDIVSFMIVYNYDADLEVSDTCVRSSLLS